MHLIQDEVNNDYFQVINIVVFSLFFIIDKYNYSLLNRGFASKKSVFLNYINSLEILIK
jgi:hypothetical protein